MRWITDDWRLKLLAVGLSVLMLGAVAFSQNPPTTKTFTKGIDYIVPAGLMVINPPTRTTVTVVGLANTIVLVTPSSVTVTVDLSNASPGNNVKVTPVAKSLVQGVNIQSPPAPIALNIDQRAAVRLTVVVRTPNVTPGWEVTRAEARCPTSPCSVTFDGPVSLETNLKAYADFTSPVENNSYDRLTQQIVLEENGTPLDYVKLASSVVPPAGLDITTASIHIEAKTGTTSRQVTLVDAPPSNPPPACYRITDIKVDPPAVILIGAPDALGTITSITLPAVDLSHSTATASFNLTITYPEGVTGSVAKARVTYTISQNPNCATPSP